MKGIDFTQPGGFPLTQDQLGYLQTAWQEVVNELLSVGVNNSAPTILSGMVSSAAGGTTTVSAGWFVYNGNAVRFPMQTYATAVAAGYAVYVVVTPSATPLTFNNGSTPDVVLDSTGVLAVLVNTTPIDATHFLLNSIVPWGLTRSFSNAGIVYNPVGLVVLSVADLGAPYYGFSYNINGNIVTLCGALNVANGVGPGTYSLVRLPAGATPASDVVLGGAVNDITASSGLVTITTGGYLQINATGSGGGNIYFDGVSYRLS